ncbi:MAG: type IV toxin-antitoxin system AbiEi family antitoxin domain-containing protein [Myxococcota bacterium]
MSQADALIRLAEQKRVLRPRDVDAAGIPRAVLYRLRDQGVLKRLSRGLYSLSRHEITENHTFAEVSKRIPSGVICLLSALRFHDLTTQAPFEVWLAIDRKAWRPKTSLPVRIVTMSGGHLTAGVVSHRIEGVDVPVFNAAKTVADCFRYRNKIGLDVALEALRDYRARRMSIDELWRFAQVDRVANVIRPYLEASL